MRTVPVPTIPVGVRVIYLFIGGGGIGERGWVGNGQSSGLGGCPTPGWGWDRSTASRTEIASFQPRKLVEFRKEVPKEPKSPHFTPEPPRFRPGWRGFPARGCVAGSRPSLPQCPPPPPPETPPLTSSYRRALTQPGGGRPCGDPHPAAAPGQCGAARGRRGLWGRRWGCAGAEGWGYGDGPHDAHGPPSVHRCGAERSGAAERSGPSGAAGVGVEGGGGAGRGAEVDAEKGSGPGGVGEAQSGERGAGGGGLARQL